MKIVAKSNGTKTEMDLPSNIRCLVHQPDIRVDALDADCIIDSRKTVECMEKMSQRAWEHISTGPLFQQIWAKFYEDSTVVLPASLKELNEDYDIGVIHSVGLVILMCEARFAGKKKIFVRTPEDHLHPRIQRYLMTMINMVLSLPGPEDTCVDLEVPVYP